MGKAWTRWGAVWLSAAVLLPSPAPLCAQPGNETDGWKFDVIHLKNGKSLQVLLDEETPDQLKYWVVYRKPGERTSRIYDHLPRNQVARIDRLDPRDRQILAERVQRLDPGLEDALMRKVELKRVPWRGQPNGGLRYRAGQFVLDSNAHEGIVRRAAVRLDQIYEAYGRLLPARRPSGSPTAILLVNSVDEYRALLRERGQSFLNPAYYDVGRNEIVCASNLEQLGKDLEKVRKDHQAELKRLADLEEYWRQEYKGRIPKNLLAQLAQDRRKITAANEDNEKKFEGETRRLFQTLYHEAFHAYLANFVYPPGETEVPRWLNEGLAQIFETAVLQAGELRVGRPDPERLKQALAAEQAGTLVPLGELLRAGPASFVVAHASEKQVADRYYLSSWAWAFYLAFDLKKLGTPELDAYVQALKRGADPVAAYTALVGCDVPAAEEAFYRYLKDLN